MGARLGGLWRHPDFLKLWAGQTISLFGSLITRFALPLIAALALEATPFQVALLAAAEVAPALLFGLVAGVWVDRLRRRPILIAADVGRALLLATVPLAAWLGVLGIGQLYVVALLTSLLSLFFEVAYRAYLPSLVRREQLIEGNSKLEASGSVAEVAGLGLAGALVQGLTAPFALVVDAATFVVSALSLWSIRAGERTPAGGGEGPGVPGAEPGNAWREIRQGLAVIRGDRTLRAVTAATGTEQLFIHIFVATLTLFLVRELRLPPVVLGALFAIGGVSAFFGATLAEPVARRWGVGRALLGGFLVYRLMTLLIPLAGGPPPLAIGLLALSQCGDAANTIHGISRVSLLQAIVPERLQGRVNATIRTAEQAAMLIGLLIGGALGERIGLRPTLLVGALGALPAGLWLFFSPLRTLRDYQGLTINGTDSYGKAGVAGEIGPCSEVIAP